MKLIEKATVVAEIKKRITACINSLMTEQVHTLSDILDFINTLEVKEVDLNNGIQLTWEDIRELYIIFAEVDVDIELCKTADIQAETIGYYQEVMKRFKARKGE